MSGTVKILGCRGSVPCSGENYIQFGGGTTSVMLQNGEDTLFLDAGTGILGVSCEEIPGKKCTLIQTHTHADHILGLPMSALVMDPEMEIDIFGAVRDGKTVEEQLNSFLHPPVWPVGLGELPAEVGCAELPEEMDAGTFHIRSMEGAHPGGVSVLRIAFGGSTVVFMTDCMITEENRAELLDFARDADLLLIDGQYTEDQLKDRCGFGHNSNLKAAEFGLEAGCRVIRIVHHDPAKPDRVLRDECRELGDALRESGHPEEEISRVSYGFAGETVSFPMEQLHDEPHSCLTNAQMEQFLTVALGLTAERDKETLLSEILDTAMDLTNCDAGTLYLLEEDGLHFCRMVTRSMGIRQGGHANPITLPPVPLDPAYLCSWSLLNNATINTADIATDNSHDFSGAKRYDAMTGYHTQSMLVVPLANDRGELIGVLQLINALDKDGDVIPFDPSVELLTKAAASQAASTFTNMKYSEQVVNLLDSLVSALSTAIDERTPYNANHTRNMVRYGAAFLDWLGTTDYSKTFNEEERRGFLMSVWLHDVGKLVVPLEVMDKETRLGPALAPIQARWEKIGLLERVAVLEGRMAEDEAAQRAEIREKGLEFILACNTAGFLPDEKLDAICDLAENEYTDSDGTVKKYLTGEEVHLLTIRKGTLSAEEREIMESHVSVTGKILEHVSFPKMFSQTPVWAAMHHEYLNGKGYPKHVSGDEIPWEVRLLTVLDIFDALTARDRPYKPGMPVEKALAILHSMVDEGSLDNEIVNLFEQSKAWEDKK